MHVPVSFLSLSWGTLAADLVHILLFPADRIGEYFYRGDCYAYAGLM